jgi:hypothetical protein
MWYVVFILYKTVKKELKFYVKYVKYDIYCFKINILKYSI